MSRSIQVSLPSEETERIVPEIRKLEGLIGLRVQKNASLHPRGDVLEVDLINSEVNHFLILFEEEGLLGRNDVSITTSRPTNVISKDKSEKILSETHETSWEDMLKNLLHQSNMSINTQLVMFLAGLMAALGISSNSLHIVIGAMLVAPGFEPISRTVMGLVSKHRDWKKGLLDIFKGYSVLIIGGIVGALIFELLGKDSLPGTSSYLPVGVLPEYWSVISPTSVIISVFASLAGGLIIMSNKSLLTAGVMVALALIPSGALVGMRIVEGEYSMAGTAMLRLLLEITIVAVFTGIIFGWKRMSTHKRNMCA